MATKPKRRACVVYTVVGSKFDAPNNWRPSLQLARHPDRLPVTKIVLLEQAVTQKFTDALVRDIGKEKPEIECERVTVPLKDPFSFEEVYSTFYEFCRSQSWQEDTDYYIHLTTGTHVMQIVWYLLISEHFAPAQLVQTRPSTTSRPSGVDIVTLDLNQYPALARRKHRERLAGQSLLKMGITTKSPEYNKVIEQLQRAALGPAVPMLITGETGTGKSALARRVYELRKNARVLSGPLVEVNCATLHGTLRESALFGHKRGAFTGADRDRKGYLLAANEGMLFLDEVGELALEEQAMLLTAIEEGRFYALGSDSEVHSKFALVCGTNRDLRLEVRAGRFRDDLLARLSVWTFRLPPLRDRREDIEENLRYELERFCESYRRQARFSKTAFNKYLSFAMSTDARWTHNFRDLSQSVLRMASLAQEGLIDTDDVTQEIATLRESWRRPEQGQGETASIDDNTHNTHNPHNADGDDGTADLDRVDRVVHALIVKALQQSRSLAEAGRWVFDAKSNAKGSNYSDKMKKLCARYAIDPQAYLRD